jgi:hypothetical protein
MRIVYVAPSYAARALKATAKLVVILHCHGTSHTTCNSMNCSR